MAVLAGLFGGAQEPAQDSEKLLHLYWNRAELKKEFATLRKEQYRLSDLVKQHEGNTARLQQKLDYVENLLIDPEWANNVVAFYQLRGLAQRCERKLANFAEQLKEKREQKQHNALLVKWNEQRTREARHIETEISGLRESVMMLEGKLESERNRLIAMSGFLKIFRRRAVTAKLDDIRAEISAAQGREIELVEKVQQIKDRRPPDTQGLDIATKRSINHMIIAYAQQLYLHMGDSDFAALVKEANDKSVGAVKYGSRADCEHLLQRVQKRVQVLDRSNDVAAILQKRAQLIGEGAKYRAEDDAVPVVTSVATVYVIGADGKTEERKENIVGENYFGIAKYLSR